jgi:hypothetical protein
MKLGRETMYLNIIKAINNKATTNIILNMEKLKPFLLKSGTRQECSFSSFLFNTVLEFLTRAISQEEEIKGIQIGKKEMSLFVDDMIIYLRDPENSSKKLGIINTFDKVVEYKIYLQKSVALLYTKNLGKQSHL